MFGPFELSIGERILRRDDQALPLGSRALDILIYLTDRPGEVIAKQVLIDHVWPDVTVEEVSVRVHKPRSARHFVMANLATATSQTSRGGVNGKYHNGE
jgi:DNA-binding response OmpR family regulator